MTSSRPKPLLRARIIQRRVRELAAEIAADHFARHGDQPLALLALMDGACCFAVDLARALRLPDVRLHFVRATSYGAGTVSIGRVALGTLPDLGGLQVLIVDDILDTGRTMAAVRLALAPQATRTCVLLDKPMRRVAEGTPTADYIGFTIPDLFVVGYGLDLAGRYRQLPDVCVLPPGGSPASVHPPKVAGRR
jgi:hypoxanthine phosphoribosyltransferase